MIHPTGATMMPTGHRLDLLAVCFALLTAGLFVVAVG